MSHLEDTLLWQIKAAGLPMPEREYRAPVPPPTRKPEQLRAGRAEGVEGGNRVLS